jgi:tRNA A-37 threonylcarbamoyl transferase component Bud32
MADLSIRLRRASPGLLNLPWLDPLAAWPPEAADFRELPVGPSRHTVRFVNADGVLYALKELPTRVARKEYQVLRDLEARMLPAVAVVGLVEQPSGGNAILVTEFLDHSWQYRRLFQRLPRLAKHRERLLDAMAILLVDLHRAGVFWGDCSLANTLFKRDGQSLQAFLVDAETSEVHPSLSDGQRGLDLEILVDNVTGDLLDLAVALDGGDQEIDEHLAAASSVASRYRQLWGELTSREVFGLDERYKVAGRVRHLNELGFAVDELELEPVDSDASCLRLKVAVANRRFHVEQLRRLTGLEVGEGQATVLMNDLRGFQARLERERPGSAGDEVIGARWLAECFRPGAARAVAALGAGGVRGTPRGSPGQSGELDSIQAYCDLLEVRWLLSERAGRDVGDQAALEALASRQAPPESAAAMAVVEAPTGSFQRLGRDA